MKINGSPDLLPVDRGTAGTGAFVKSPAASATERPGVDRLEFSDLAARLDALRRELGVEPELDPRRVAAAQEEIKRGIYTPDPDAIAEKMIAAARELLPRKA